MQQRPRLYTDENIDPILAEILSEHGYDVISCHAAGNANQGLSDDWQLEWATNEGRAILTYNVRDFTAISVRWGIEGREHAGIILANTGSLSQLIERTKHHLDVFTRDSLYNVTIWLV